MGSSVDLFSVSKSLGGQVVVNDVSLSVRGGEFFSLLGPSGCGKSTTLRLIAGFEKPCRGDVLIHGKPMNGKPAYAGEVNLVFQNYALFPHLTVWENVAFGLRMEKRSEAEIRKQVGAMVDLVRLNGYEARLPRQLSGGQQQRVALARALATKPSIVLLDEPLGALDLKLRKEMQSELKSLQRSLGHTFIYVTHDQEEALTMSDRIAVMCDGRVLQCGTPEDIYERPATRFVADFIGETNLFSATARRCPTGAWILETGGLSMRALSGPESGVGSSVCVAIRPEKVRVSPWSADGAEGSNRFDGVVEESSYFGSARVLQVRLGDSFKVSARQQNQGLAYPERGDRVVVDFPEEALAVLLDDEFSRCALT